MTAIRLHQRIGTILGALLLVGIGSTALAQSTTNKTSSKTVNSKTAKTKPVAAKRKAPAAQGGANSDYWSINYAAPDRYETGRAASRNSGNGPPDVGRVPLQGSSGTVGFDTESRVTRSVPGGADPYARKDSSFVGLSVNVPSLDKNLPLPVLPTPWSRPE